MRLSSLLAALAVVCLIVPAHAAPRHERRATAFVNLHNLGGRVDARALTVDLSGLALNEERLTALQQAEADNIVLDGSQVTDAQLTQIAALPGLQSLSLADTGVTDAGLNALVAVKGLNTIDLSGTKVTAAGIAKLKLAHPELVIVKRR